jgi:hypothetical protein
MDGGFIRLQMNAGQTSLYAASETPLQRPGAQRVCWELQFARLTPLGDLKIPQLPLGDWGN